MLKKVTNTIFYVGANDHDVDLFEGQYVVPNGMAYNSYVILDEKVAVMDTIDASKTEEWLKNIEKVLADRLPDYLIVQHMEPDHAASIEAFMNVYPAATVVANTKTFNMIGNFFPNLTIQNTLYRSNNARNLARMFPGETKFRPFLSRNVADPWYTGDFTQTWLDIVEGCERIMKEVL